MNEHVSSVRRRDFTVPRRESADPTWARGMWTRVVWTWAATLALLAAPSFGQAGISFDKVPAPGAKAAHERGASDRDEAAPRVAIETRFGVMTFRLLSAAAPQTVAHFERLVRSGFYDGKPFYRIVAGHVIQGGDGGDSDQPTVKGEFGAHDHVEGALGLARDADPDSGSTGIYICLADRPHLDGGYAVFGLIETGVEVLRAIGAVEVTEQWTGTVAFHKPVEPVLIDRARIVAP